MRTGAKTYFVSLVGNDIAGASIRQGMEAIGMTTRYLSDTDTHATAVKYPLILLPPFVSLECSLDRSTMHSIPTKDN
ncbi:hypothetical protein BDF14DRAFT_1778059 [Spinellus fusiger]|nr:hypothetical protein BDF14DRAFT_1778059 [Spinellus fusiger]